MSGKSSVIIQKLGELSMLFCMAEPMAPAFLEGKREVLETLLPHTWCVVGLDRDERDMAGSERAGHHCSAFTGFPLHC